MPIQTLSYPYTILQIDYFTNSRMEFGNQYSCYTTKAIFLTGVRNHKKFGTIKFIKLVHCVSLVCWSVNSLSWLVS